MPLDFVRYTPEMETIDPDLDRLLEQIIDFWEKKVRESPVVEGSGRAVRGAHAKTFGVVKAEVQILRNVPPAYAQGIYAKPGRHGALIRFSSASNHLGADATLGGVLGCAMKIFDVPGSKLVEDEPDSATFDLVLKNNPIFVANTAKHYLVLQEIGNNVPQYLARGKTGFHELLTEFVTGKGTFEQSDWAWDELFAFVKLSQTPVRNPLLTTFWSMAAVRHGDYVAKVTGIFPFTKGGAKRLRGLLQLLDGNFQLADAVGTVHDMRFVFLDNDTKLLFATAYDGEWDAYIEDFATKIPNALDLLFCDAVGWPGIRSPKVKDWIVEHQVSAEAWYVANPNLTVTETRRLERVGKAVEELLDKIG